MWIGKAKKWLHSQTKIIYHPKTGNITGWQDGEYQLISFLVRNYIIINNIKKVHCDKTGVKDLDSFCC